MKQIEPVTIWSNGQDVQATILDAFVQNDNLLNQASFSYTIGVATGDIMIPVETVSSGILRMTGQAYVEYQTNQYAWDWIAAQLNLTIIGEYTTTTTTTTAIPTTEETTTVI